MENYNPSTSTTSTSTHNTNQPQLLPTTTTTSVSTIEQNKPTSNQGNDQGSSKQATGTFTSKHLNLTDSINLSHYNFTILRTLI